MTPSAHAILSILLAEGPTFARDLATKSGVSRRMTYVALKQLMALEAIEPHEYGQRIALKGCATHNANFLRVDGACVKCGGVLVGAVKRVCRHCSNALRRDLVPLAAGVDLYRRAKHSAQPLTPYAVAIRLEWPVWSHVVDGKVVPGMADAILDSGEMSDEEHAKWKRTKREWQRANKRGGE